MSGLTDAEGAEPPPVSPSLDALVAAAKERLHRSIGQKARRAHEAIARQAKAMREGRR